ncbi:hypothetical protein Ahy_B04g073056 isoform C [Arachis hypogaea]|uniref:MULE transposase domain-containing protein n=1 Tax=Arachis hypogaea TaxID=3818 RepID=A0A444ZPH0_ARAHY|nr:hypothetical protein Ahy_B04g073056 isoform C [Arachis hypogaea]
MLTAKLIQDNWFAIKQEKDIGSTLKRTIGKDSIGQLLMLITRLRFILFITIREGGYDKVGFTNKDLHNHISKTRHGKVKDGDAFAALADLLSKLDSDLLFLEKFTLKDGKLDNLVWVDEASVVDYECFGNVLAFDTTYKKNVYNKPLVIFSRTNHHVKITIFGGALLSDERSETFKWTLKEFLEIMSDKLLGDIVTDEDHAMRDAILELFPDIPHRLCEWHVHHNAVQNIKNKYFWDDFNVLLYKQFIAKIFQKNQVRSYRNTDLLRMNGSTGFIMTK